MIGYCILPNSMFCACKCLIEVNCPRRPLLYVYVLYMYSACVCTYVYMYIHVYVYIHSNTHIFKGFDLVFGVLYFLKLFPPLLLWMYKVFTNGPGDLGSMPGWVIPKTLPCVTLSIIRWRSRVMWSNPGNGLVSSPSLWCSSYRKGSLWITLDYGSQLYLHRKHWETLMCIRMHLTPYTDTF